MSSLANKTPAVRIRIANRDRSQDVDRQVSARIRERRVMLGMTQQETAELIGITYQQAHKYEKAISRISAGRLYQLAVSLGVEVDYFFKNAESHNHQQPISQHRLLMELVRSFLMIRSRKHRDALFRLVQALSHDA